MNDKIEIKEYIENTLLLVYYDEEYIGKIVKIDDGKWFCHIIYNDYEFIKGIFDNLHEVGKTLYYKLKGI